MSTTHDQFKLKFIQLLSDLKSSGVKDKEALGLIGFLGAHVADAAKMESWSGAKARLTPQGFRDLHKKLVEQGHLEIEKGKRRAAYAVQAFVMSMTARASKDPEVKAGEKVLDNFLDEVVAMHRKAKAAAQSKAS